MSDELPYRLERHVTTAENIAICVMRMKNVTEAAALIQLYADNAATAARAEATEDKSQ
jgi:hypothetical protein